MNNVMFHCCSFNATAHLSHLNTHSPVFFLLSLYTTTFSVPCVLSTLSFSFPLYGLSAHCFHVLLLSFSILTCLAHFSVTANWILYFNCTALTLPTESYFSALLYIPFSWHCLDSYIFPLFCSFCPQLFSFHPMLIKNLSHLPSSQILSGVMLEVLSEDFPEFFTAEVQMVWTKLMGAVYWHVTGAYTEVGWLQVSSSAV